MQLPLSAKILLIFIVILILGYRIFRIMTYRTNLSVSSDDRLFEGPEALGWLQSNQHPYALASNRFETTQEAINFVKSLYQDGVIKVSISKECMRDEKEGSYADGIFIKLPPDSNAKRKVLERCRQEMALHEVDSRSHDQIFLWWD